jgi:hypothetical protein
MDQLVLHHAGEAEQGANATPGAGTANRSDIVGGEYAFQIVAVLAGADNGHHFEVPGDRDEREELVVPEAEDEALTSGMGGVHDFAVHFFDAKRRAYGLVDVDQQEGCESRGEMHIFLMGTGKMKNAFLLFAVFNA